MKTTRYILLAAALALASLVVTAGCVNAAAHDVAVKLQKAIEDAELASRPISDKKDHVARYEAAWASVRSGTADIVRVTGR